jgi:hypothetical protein
LNLRELVWCISNSGANFRLDTTAQNAQRRLVAGVRANFPLAVEPTRRCRKHVKVINNNHAHFLRRMLFGSSGQALSRQVRVMKMLLAHVTRHETIAANLVISLSSSTSAHQPIVISPSTTSRSPDTINVLPNPSGSFDRTPQHHRRKVRT